MSKMVSKMDGYAAHVVCRGPSPCDFAGLSVEFIAYPKEKDAKGGHYHVDF